LDYEHIIPHNPYQLREVVKKVLDGALVKQAGDAD